MLDERQDESVACYVLVCVQPMAQVLFRADRREGPCRGMTIFYVLTKIKTALASVEKIHKIVNAVICALRLHQMLSLMIQQNVPGLRICVECRRLEVAPFFADGGYSFPTIC